MIEVGVICQEGPLALQTSKNPSQVLMPLSFGTILGGMMTEIGTPPNIIIASYRQKITGEGFSLFDFAPVGIPLTLLGVMFLVLFGWRLIPSSRRAKTSVSELLEGASYITEAQVDEESRVIGKTVRQMERMVDNEALAVGFIRNGLRHLGRIREKILQQGDIVILRAESTAFHKLLEVTDMSLVGDGVIGAEELGSDEISLLEFVIMPGARLEWRSAHDISFTERYGVKLLALARQGERVEERLSHAQFRAGDVLLVQGDREIIQSSMASLGCIPLAERGLQPIRKRKRLLPVFIFMAAIAATASGLVPVQVSFSCAVVALVLFELIPLRDVYESIDWSVVVLLGALIPLGMALETSGASQSLAHWLVGMAAQIPVWGILALVMALTMVLTNLMNNAATAVMMAPIAVSIAGQLQASIDPFLMATAIAASSAFLTPIGHQNNVLVMGPGGYQFGDYWRMGLPLQILIIVIAVPLITLVWPL